MTDADLEFLLTSVPTQSFGFWRRIGRGLETPQIARLELPEYSANLQVLVVANSDILFTRGMRVRHEQPKLDEGRISAEPRWIVSHKCLALRGSNWTAYIAPESVANLPPAEKHVGPAVLDLRARTDRWACKIEKLELDAGDRVISYSSKEGEDVVHDDRLSALADQRTTRVRRATVALPGGRRLGIDFTNLSATGQTSATFTIGEMVKSALPIMVALDEDETNFLERLPRGESSPADGEQEVLDLDI